MRAFLCMLVLGSLALIGAARQHGLPGPDAAVQSDELSPVTGVTTLYSLDPLAQTLAFDTGEFGRVFQGHSVRNWQSDIDFDQYVKGAFSIGVESGREGRIVDLGTPAELQAKYGYQERVGGGQGFASIHCADGEIRIRAAGDESSMQTLLEASALFGEGTSSAEVCTGHVYLVRLVDRYEPDFQRIAKLLVLAYAPGESVTFRWVRIG